VKLFIAEQGTDKMSRFASSEDDRNKVVSALARIETRSAIRRLQQGRFITSAEASLALDLLEDELRRIVEQPVNPPVLEAASALIDRHCLRSLDAVQLGSAIVARDLLAAPDMRFMASDKTLIDAAQAEGFDIWNPAV
jgi:predicted nucleic acid-binding protein